jgi:carboxylate-amine ligase
MRNIRSLEKKLNNEVRALNHALSAFDAMLLPTAAHPFFDPAKQTQLWNGDGKEVPERYNEMFGCHQHGWSNTQRLRLELPFGSGEDFTKLHAAVRLMLPIIPALCASSPLLEDREAGARDARLARMLVRHEKLPPVAGTFIPEAVFTQEEYYREIFAPIGKVLARVDKKGILDHLKVNSRAACPDFDRGMLALRVIDPQECVSADLAVLEIIIATVKALVQGRWVSSYLQRAWNEQDLLALFQRTITDGLDAVLEDKDYLLMFGVLREEKLTARRLWAHLLQEVRATLSEHALVHGNTILKSGNLADRILRHTGRKPAHERITATYRELAKCLAEDRVLG